MGIKPNNQGLTMLKWMKDIWSFPRSLTGHGTHATLEYLRQINKDLTIQQTFFQIRAQYRHHKYSTRLESPNQKPYFHSQLQI